MGSEFLQVNFRMPPDLKQKLEESAKRAGRSLTAEVIHRLQASFDESRNQGLEDEIEELAIRLQAAEQQWSAARTEVEILRDAGKAMDRSLKSQEAMHMLVFSIMRKIIEMLPPGKKKEPLAAVALQLANTVIHKDGPGIAVAFADLFAGDPEVVEGMQQLARELVETPPSKKSKRS